MPAIAASSKSIIMVSGCHCGSILKSFSNKAAYAFVVFLDIRAKATGKPYSKFNVIKLILIYNTKEI